MDDCPYCDKWRYDQYAECICVRQLDGSPFPVVWDGQRLRVACGSEAPNGRHTAAARHICREHPMEPDVLVLGPLVEYAPLAAFNAFAVAMTAHPVLGPSRKERQRIRELMD